PNPLFLLHFPIDVFDLPPMPIALAGNPLAVNFRVKMRRSAIVSWILIEASTLGGVPSGLSLCRGLLLLASPYVWDSYSWPLPMSGTLPPGLSLCRGLFLLASPYVGDSYSWPLPMSGTLTPGLSPGRERPA